MASVAHNLEYLATLSDAKLAQSLSEESADWLGERVGNLMYRVLSSRRRVALVNLKRALGDQYSDDQLEAITRKVFDNIGQTLVEFSRFEKLGLDGVRRIVTGPGRELFENAHDEGNGAILLTAHFGNWELMGAWVATLGYPMDILVGTQHNQKVNDLVL